MEQEIKILVLVSGEIIISQIEEVAALSRVKRGDV